MEQALIPLPDWRRGSTLRSLATHTPMKSCFFLFLFAFMLAACGSEPGSSEPGSSETRGGTSSDPNGVTSRADSLQAIIQQRGEPGIPGSDIPTNVWQDGPGTCYSYDGYIIRIHGNDVGGEDIAVFSGDDRGQCEASLAQALFSTGTNGDTETFFGIVGDLLLLERATEEEHLIRVVDLASGSVVHETPYEEPVEIRDGGLLYGEPAEVFESQEGLNAVGVDCPESGVWFEDSLAVGVSIRSRFDLTPPYGGATLTDDVICIPLL